MQENAFMRTTLELPDHLLKRAKIEAVERGITLKELVGLALQREMDGVHEGIASRRVRFPVFASDRPGSLHLSRADLARAEDDEDRRRHDLPG
jgi:hypothetical protein